MHFVTLATVELPHIEEDEELNAKIAEKAENLKEQAKTDYMAGFYYRQIQSKLSSFSRAVDDALFNVMEPFWLNTENPEYLEFDDYTDEVEDEYHSDSMTCVRLPEGRVVPTGSHEFYAKFTLENGIVQERGVGRLHHPKRTHKAKKLHLLKNYPIRKVFPSIKDYAEHEGYYHDEDGDRYGYMCNPNGQWDWYSLGGRWPDVLLVSSQCKEYSLGECDWAHREPPEGYKWVSAARKKDIAWNAMRSWRKSMAIKEFEMLKTAFETKTRPEGYFFQVREDGVRSPSGRVYLSGDTQESFLERCGIDDSDLRYPDCFYYYISDGKWISCDEYSGYEENDEDHNEEWHNAMHKFIDSLSDDTVLAVVDCHM